MDRYRSVRAAMAVFNVNLKTELAYKADLVLRVGFMLVSSLVYIGVWFAVYSFSGSSAIQGLTISGMVAYFLLIGALNQIVGWSGIMNNLQNDIQSGGIVRLFIRPMGYVKQLVIEALPEDAITLVCVTVPMIVIITVLGNLHVTASILLLFVAEIVIAYAIANLIGFIIGSMTVYLTNIYGIANGINLILGVVGGYIAPLIFFPQSVSNILMLTPFPMIMYVPVGTLIGIVQPGAAMSAMLVGLAWIAVLAVVARVLWAKVSRAVNAVGV